MFKIISFLLAIAVVGTAQGQVSPNPDDVTLGNPAVAGTGCPLDTVDYVLSADNKSLSILFDDFVAIAEPGGRDRKNCDIAIPVNVPSGYSVSIIKLDYRGYAFLPWGATGTFSAEYFFAGSRGPRFRERLSGYYDDDYLFNNELVASASNWSACGQQVILRSKATLNVRNRGDEDAEMGIDSVDTMVENRFAFKYFLSWRRCGS